MSRTKNQWQQGRGTKHHGFGSSDDCSGSFSIMVTIINTWWRLWNNRGHASKRPALTVGWKRETVSRTLLLHSVTWFHLLLRLQLPFQLEAFVTWTWTDGALGNWLPLSFFSGGRSRLMKEEEHSSHSSDLKDTHRNTECNLCAYKKVPFAPLIGEWKQFSCLKAKLSAAECHNEMPLMELVQWKWTMCRI